MDIQKIKLAEEKYFVFSPELITIAKNIDFIYSIRNAILDYFCGVSIIFALYLTNYNDKTDKDDLSYSTTKKNITVSIIRLATVITVAVVVCGVKILAIPHNTLKATEIDSSVKTDKGFYSNSQVLKQSRAIGYGDANTTVFSQSKVTLCHNGDELLSYDVDGEYYATTIQIDGNEIIMSDKLETIDINGTEVVVSFDRAAAYMKNGTPYAVEFKNLAIVGYDEVLLNTCQFLIEKGRFECFEYICEYVVKYDFSLIEPYIERYAKGDFTDEEISNNSNINLEYITHISQILLQR